MIRCLRYLALFILFPSVVCAAVSGVTGTISNGESITVSGTAFGSTGPTVLLYDDFENGTDEAQLSTSVSPTVGADYASVQAVGNTSYSSTDVNSGSLAARFDNEDYTVNLHPLILFSHTEPFTDFYMSWWELVPSGYTFPGVGAGGGNWKTVWLYAPGGDGTSSPNANYTISSNGSWWSVFGNGYPPVPDYMRDQYDSSQEFTSFVGTWHRWQLHIKLSLTTSGYEVTWLTMSDRTSNLGDYTRRTEYDAAVITLASGGVNTLQHVSVNGYVRDTSNSHTVFDDVYLAIGSAAQARVEIGNANTYAGCTSLAMCTTTSWGDTSITCTVRQGNLPDSAEAWVYVTPSDGTTQAAYSVTFSESSAGTSYGQTGNTTHNQTGTLQFTQ